MSKAIIEKISPRIKEKKKKLTGIIGAVLKLLH